MLSVLEIKSQIYLWFLVGQAECLNTQVGLPERNHLPLVHVAHLNMLAKLMNGIVAFEIERPVLKHWKRGLEPFDQQALDVLSLCHTVVPYLGLNMHWCFQHPSMRFSVAMTTLN